MAGEPIREPVRVEVWSDLVCPWCYIGKRRIEQALTTLRDDPGFSDDIELVYRPFQLDPTARRGASEPVADAYARKFGGLEPAAMMMERVTAAAAQAGIEFHLDRARRANTADAHRLLWWAFWAGGPLAQADLEESLMQAYFVDGDDIGSYDVLVERTARAGLDAGSAREVLESEDGVEALAVALRRAAEQGIAAVPTYVVDGRWSIPGAQDAAVFEQVFRRLAANRTESTSA